jgi:hypothetical protein
MALVPVDLDPPQDVRNRWAAHAAVMAALGHGSLSNATSTRWRYDDAGGNWADLVLLDGGRAVLFGHDHEYSETYFREAAEYFQEEETDLLADAPEWWGSVLPSGDDQWIGFVYGFDGTSWSRADYELDDGFASVAVPACSDGRLHEMIIEFVQGAGERAGSSHVVEPAAIDALVALGPAITTEALASVFGDIPGNYEQGVAAAAAFAAPQ